MLNTKLTQKGNQNFDQLSNLEYVAPNVCSSQCEAQLYICEDKEAVIKMTIKGRSPTMRHVSRTRRVASYCLFERINLDTEIQIKYVDTKNQLADFVTNGSFMRDEWNHLLRLFNIMNLSMFSLSHFRSIEKGNHHVEESSRKEDRRPEKSLR